MESPSSDRGPVLSKSSITKRLSVVERQLETTKGKITEFYIEGGLSGSGVAVRAHIIGGQCYEGEPGEEFESFRKRIRAIAETEGADAVVFGGLPPTPTEWAEPPGMEEALARAGRTGDEIDLDP
jgi:hypothetical protein